MLKRPIRLDMNEVPTLPPSNVMTAARRGLRRLNCYADAEDLAYLQGLLGEYAGVHPAQVIVGPGSDLLLREIVLTFGQERTVITPSPTFLPTVETVQQVAPDWISLRLSPPTFALPHELLLDVLSGPSLLIVDNPNNPTGRTLLDRQTVQAVVEREDVLLVIDEAYNEFIGMPAHREDAHNNSFVDLVEDYANLAVTRTMDKAFSLAGARIGYTVVGEAFRKAFAGFYGFLPQSSLYAAIEALENPAYVGETVEWLVKERERVRETLENMGARVTPSETNFLLVRTDVGDAVGGLRDAGVLVSDVSNQLPPGFIRVSVGTREQNDAFLAAFRQIKESDQDLTRGEPIT